MGLDKFSTESQQDSETEDETVEGIASEKEKLRKAELCPRCGEEGEHLRTIEYRCTNPECESLSWFTNPSTGGE